MNPTPETPLGDLDGWWIETQCRCRTVQHPVRLLLRDLSPERTARDVAARMRCRKCGERPVAHLIDDPQLGAFGYVTHSDQRQRRVALTRLGTAPGR